MKQGSDRLRGGRKRWVWFLPLLALLISAETCDPLNPSLNPSVQVQEDRAPATGSLREITINGSGFTASGTVRITYTFSLLGGGSRTVKGADISANGSGNFQFKHRTPTMCPPLASGERGKFTGVVALDLTGNRAASKDLHPGQESDCVSF